MKDALLMLSTYFRSLKKDEKGQGMVEYALILFLVSIVALIMLEAIGTNVNSVFTQIRDALM